MTYLLRYFASLADAAGCSEEQWESAATEPSALYAELIERHGFVFPVERLRVAINGRFAAWQTALADGDEIVFLPPVSGG